MHSDTKNRMLSSISLDFSRLSEYRHGCSLRRIHWYNNVSIFCFRWHAGREYRSRTNDGQQYNRISYRIQVSFALRKASFWLQQANALRSPATLLYIALCFGFSLMVNAWVFFRISGGLFNPAVSVEVGI